MLRPSAAKTEVGCFHLNNKLTNQELSIIFESNLLTHKNTPKYLGITLDKTLSFKKHLSQTAAKLNTRNNILHKLCGTIWGFSASTLSSPALELVYSIAQYCDQGWLKSTHSRKVDVQLNNSMWIISGTIKSTSIRCLPILSHIPPPHLCRQNTLVREYRKIISKPQLTIHFYAHDLERNRYSRNPSPKLLQSHQVMEVRMKIKAPGQQT